MASGFPARVAVVAICAMAGHAHADRRPVAVVSLTADPDATELANQLYPTLVNHPDLQPLLETAALKGTFLDEDAENLGRARRARADADSALGLAQPAFSSAATAAQIGTNALAMVTPSAEMLQIYADLMFDMGQAQLGEGKPIEASRSFALARRLDPNRRPDPAKYVQEIVDAYEATANKPVAQSQLTIKGEGSAWIDGKLVGDAPHGEPVEDGLHLVQLTGPDRETRGEQVLVPAIADVTVAPAPATEELKIKRARLELSHAKDPMTRASAVKRLAKLLGVADAVIISKSSAGALLVQTWQDREPGFSAIREHTNEKPLDLLTPLAPPRKIEPPKVVEPPFTPPPIVIEKPWCRKTWVQASAATGIVAIIVTAVMIARADRMTTFSTDIKPDEPK
jgi:hypothetical protein